MHTKQAQPSRPQHKQGSPWCKQGTSGRNIQHLKNPTKEYLHPTTMQLQLEPAHCELRQKHACARRMYCKRILVEQMFVVRLHLKDDKAIREHKQNANQNDGPQCNFVWRERMGEALWTHKCITFPRLFSWRPLLRWGREAAGRTPPQIFIGPAKG